MIARLASLAHALCVLGFVALLVVPAPVQAGGLYLMPRGVGPSSMAGARVAGSEGVHALWYNPAGLAMGDDRELTFDLTLPRMRAHFRREIALENGGHVSEPTAHARSSPVPIPTLGYVDSLGLRRVRFGIALLVPPGTTLDWPTRVNGAPAPQRYAILDTRGSAIATLALGVSYQPIDALSLGAALHITAAQVGGSVAVSACDYAVCQIPEGREWEGRTRFLLGPVYTASANFGAIYRLSRLELGLSGQLRTTLSGEASFDVRLPDQAFFDGVRVEDAKGGDDLRAGMKVVLPGVLRAGVALHASDDLELELSTTWERWSVQDALRVTPKDVFVRDIPALGDVRAQSVTLARNMKDTVALALGGSYSLARVLGRALDVNGGVMLENGAFDDRDLSATTLDTDKLLVAVGASVYLTRGVTLDVSYGHLFMENRSVTDSRVVLPSAIRPTPAERPVIANGRYVMESDYIGLGLRWTPGPRPDVGLAARR